MDNVVATQTIQLIGALLCLIPFAAVQVKRMRVETRAYQVMNFGGAALLTMTAIINHQYGFILLEGIWAAMSLLGLLRLRASA
jgi:hypothetical protein